MRASEGRRSGTVESATLRPVGRQLPGGNAGGAVLVEGTIRRAAGPWTAAVHELLRYLEAQGFAGAPRVLGIDEQGREVLSYLRGETVGERKPWPPWVHSDQALVDVGRWLRRYHEAVADFVPRPDAVWRLTSRPRQPGDIIGHNDAAPYNAVWRPSEKQSAGRQHGGLVGFIDWDFAAPCSPLWDLAYTAFSWTPLHARDVVAAEGFTNLPDRPRRLRLLLDAYQYTGSIQGLLIAVRARVADLSNTVVRLANQGDPLFARMRANGVLDSHARALAELDRDAHLSFDALE
jgi:hypothetical protein